jgi:hypothetical protein
MKERVMVQNAKASLGTRGILERGVNAADRRYSNIAVSKVVRDFMETKAPGIIAAADSMVEKPFTRLRACWFRAAA